MIDKSVGAVAIVTGFAVTEEDALPIWLAFFAATVIV
jgi:hypothetical protein